MQIYYHMIYSGLDSPIQPSLAPGFLGLSFKMLPLEYFLFLQIILFLFITPGTPRIVIISYSMNYGVNKCIWTALGDISANFIQGTLVIFVIGSFFKVSNFYNFNVQLALIDVVYVYTFVDVCEFYFYVVSWNLHYCSVFLL